MAGLGGAAGRVAVLLAHRDVVGRGQSAVKDFGGGPTLCLENPPLRRFSGALIGAMGFLECDGRGLPGASRSADGKPEKEGLMGRPKFLRCLPLGCSFGFASGRLSDLADDIASIWR